MPVHHHTRPTNEFGGFSIRIFESYAIYLYSRVIRIIICIDIVGTDYYLYLISVADCDLNALQLHICHSEICSRRCHEIVLGTHTEFHNKLEWQMCVCDSLALSVLCTECIDRVQTLDMAMTVAACLVICSQNNDETLPVIRIHVCRGNWFDATAATTNKRQRTEERGRERWRYLVLRRIKIDRGQNVMHVLRIYNQFDGLLHSIIRVAWCVRISLFVILLATHSVCVSILLYGAWEVVIA